MQYIYCKVKTRIQRELSHTIKLRCACVSMYSGYIWWLTYFYYAPWKHISLLKLENNFARKEGLSYSSFLLFFFGGHLSTHCFRYLGHLSIFSSFFINNFCIAPCFFYATKLLRDSNKNLEHLFGGYPNKNFFGVFSWWSKTFLDGSRWKACFCAYPQCRNSAYVGCVYVNLILRAWQTSHKASTKLD